MSEWETNYQLSRIARAVENQEATNRTRGGIGFCGLLTIAFIVLKLLGVITWSWWWVFAPIWIPVALVLAFVLFALLISLLVALFT